MQPEIVTMDRCWYCNRNIPVVNGVFFPHSDAPRSSDRCHASGTPVEDGSKETPEESR